MEKTASIKKERDRIMIRRFDGMEMDLSWISLDERRDDPELTERTARLLFEMMMIKIDTFIVSYVEKLRSVFMKNQENSKQKN